MSKITQSADISNVKAEEFQRFASIWIKAANDIINGQLDFGNFRAQTLSITFIASGTEVASPHNLGRTPTGYLVTGANAAMSVYDGSTANTESNLYLRANASGTARVIVF